MKKVLTTALAGLFCLSMLPMAMFASAAENGKITVDGKLDDWKDVKTIGIVGTEDAEGKKVTFYGKLTDDGLYMACDAVHAVYTTTQNDWWMNSNFEMFINRKGNNDNQVWVSAKGITADNKTPAKSHDQMTAAMVTVEENGKYHTITEVFLPNTLDFIKDTAGGSLRVGMAWKTPTDKINNGEANGGGYDEYWVPKGNWPNNPDKTFVTKDGIFLKSEYVAERNKGGVKVGDMGGKWTKSEDGKSYTVTGCLTGTNNFATVALGNANGKKVTVSTKVAIGSNKPEGNNGGDNAILFGVTDVNGNGIIEEAEDLYYLVDLSKAEEDGGPFVAIERNYGSWGNWATQPNDHKLKEKHDLDLKAGDEVTLTATWDPATGTITVKVNDKDIVTYTDENPLLGTGYALASKNIGGTFKDVTVIDEGATTDPTTPGGNPGGNPGGDKPPVTGSASVVIATVAVISLAGAVVLSKKRKQD